MKFWLSAGFSAGRKQKRAREQQKGIVSGHPLDQPGSFLFRTFTGNISAENALKSEDKKTRNEEEERTGSLCRFFCFLNRITDRFLEQMRLKTGENSRV